MKFVCKFIMQYYFIYLCYPIVFQSKIKDSTISTELSNLIHKMTQLSTQSILTPHSENDKSNCPLHRDNKNQSIYEHKKYIDVVEALQQFNVPNEIVKVLRLYHVFLKTEQTNNLKDTKTEKYRKSVDIFLKEFNIMVSKREREVYIKKMFCEINVFYIPEYNYTKPST